MSMPNVIEVNKNYLLIKNYIDNLGIKGLVDLHNKIKITPPTLCGEYIVHVPTIPNNIWTIYFNSFNSFNSKHVSWFNYFKDDKGKKLHVDGYTSVGREHYQYNFNILLQEREYKDFYIDGIPIIWGKGDLIIFEGTLIQHEVKPAHGGRLVLQTIVTTEEKIDLNKIKETYETSNR